MSNNALTRRQFLEAGLGALAIAAAPSLLSPPLPSSILSQTDDGRTAPTGKRPPNLIYIFADQLRACSVGCYQNDQVDTPRIDQLALEGAQFQNAVSTSPVCGPHRACLMTGRYPNMTGIVKNELKLHPDETCIAEVFSEHDYQTGYIGKWHLNGPTHNPVEDPGRVLPVDRQGFQHWVAFNAGHIYYDSKYYWRQDPNWQVIPEGQYEPDFQTTQAIGFITANRDKKFCLFVSIGTPHPRNTGPDMPPGGDYTYPYDPDSLDLRPNVNYPDTDYAKQMHAKYYGMISNFDWNIGRILDALDSLGLSEDTIVAVSSDHGDYLGSHYDAVSKFRGKGGIYAESMDVPFILRYPSKVDPAAVSNVFNSVDIMPTLLGLCRLPIPDTVAGRNFAPLLVKGAEPAEPPYGPVPSTESAFVCRWRTNGWVGVRTPEYTLECRYPTLLPINLFHNTVDPYQMANLVDHPDYQPIQDALYQELLAWVEYVDPEPWPTLANDRLGR